MMMSPRLRKLALTLHVTSSVGWIGAVASSLVLSLAGLMSQDAAVVRGAYLTLELIARFLLIPLSFASLLTGLTQSLGSKWGLFRHYWVIFKLLINLVATGILLSYTQTFNHLAAIASNGSLSDAEVLALRSSSPVLHASAAIVVLLVATVLSVYKPHGMTRYGLRKQNETRNKRMQKDSALAQSG